MRRLGVVAALLVGAAPAHAETDHDAQAWGTLNLIGAVSDRVDLGMEVQGRFQDGEMVQLLLRPSVSRKLDGGYALTAGYLYFRNAPPGLSASSEHRSWQQVSGPLGRIGALRVTGRTRLEQRFFVGGDETGWRLRQQVRGQVPLRPGSRRALVAWNETFVGLNATDWGARAGIDQTRTFVGVTTPLGRRSSIDVGYLNQLIVRTGPDRMNHVVAMIATTRF